MVNPGVLKLFCIATFKNYFLNLATLQATVVRVTKNVSLLLPEISLLLVYCVGITHFRVSLGVLVCLDMALKPVSTVKKFRPEISIEMERAWSTLDHPPIPRNFDQLRKPKSQSQQSRKSWHFLKACFNVLRNLFLDIDCSELLRSPGLL